MARGNGEGSLYYDSKRGRWTGSVTVSKGKRKIVYGKTKKECVSKMNEVKADILDGAYCDNSNMTVAEYLSKAIANEKRKNLIKPNTYIRKVETLKRIQAHPIASYRIQAVTPAVVEDYLLSIVDYSNSVIRKEYALLKRCFTDNIPEVIKVSPMAKIKCPRSTKKEVKQRALTVDEQRKLVAALSDNDIKYKTQMLIMLHTGMRMGEINALTLNDVDLRFNTVDIKRTITRDGNDIAVIGDDTKTEAGHRLIPLSRAAQELFAEAIGNYSPNAHNLIFTAHGKPISTSQVNLAFQRLCEKYDIIDDSVTGKVSLHSLRHTYATRCIEAGMSAKVLQTLLGHTDIRITMNTYCDAFDALQTADISKVEAYMQDII